MQSSWLDLFLLSMGAAIHQVVENAIHPSKSFHRHSQSRAVLTRAKLYVSDSMASNPGGFRYLSKGLWGNLHLSLSYWWRRKDRGLVPQRMLPLMPWLWECDLAVVQFCVKGMWDTNSKGPNLRNVQFLTLLVKYL